MKGDEANDSGTDDDITEVILPDKALLQSDEPLDFFDAVTPGGKGIATQSKFAVQDSHTTARAGARTVTQVENLDRQTDSDTDIDLPINIVGDETRDPSLLDIERAALLKKEIDSISSDSKDVRNQEDTDSASEGVGSHGNGTKKKKKKLINQTTVELDPKSSKFEKSSISRNSDTLTVGENTLFCSRELPVVPLDLESSEKKTGSVLDYDSSDSEAAGDSKEPKNALQYSISKTDENSNKDSNKDSYRNICGKQELPQQESQTEKESHITHLDRRADEFRFNEDTEEYEKHFKSMSAARFKHVTAAIAEKDKQAQNIKSVREKLLKQKQIPKSSKDNDKSCS